MDEVFIKFRFKFIEEALTLLNGIEKSLLDLENNPKNAELVPEIFRVMHTLKGISSMYGFNAISDLTHQLESIYEQMRENNLNLSNEIADITLKSIDHIKNLLDDEQLAKSENKINHDILTAFIDRISNIVKVNLQITEIQSINTKRIEILPQIKSYYIMLLPDEDFITKGIKLIEIFKELSNIGTYHIVKHQFSGFPGIETTNENAWGVYVTTDAEMQELENVFLFIQDKIKIVKVSNLNIFKDEIVPKPIELELILNDDEDGAYGFFINEEDFSDPKKEQINQEKPEQPPTKIAEEKRTPETKKVQSAMEVNLQQTVIQQTTVQQTARISVEAAKLDQLMFLVSELVTTNAQLVTANKFKNQLQLDGAVEKIEKLSKQFRDNALNLRLVPIEDIVLRFQRLIRDLSHSLNKEIKFITEGTDTELDKNIIDTLVEPLMHIIRNCIDHGIETPENRIAVGKPKEGIIKFSAYYSGSHVIIKIQDDGKGIDTAAILDKAIEKGFVKSDAKLTKKEIYDLIFLPGFSTAESLTHISGRGVGMDVVKKKITEVRGEVQVESELHRGSAFTIKLQQTVSIIDTLLLKAENTHFLIPLTEIEVCDEQLHTTIFKNQNKYVEFEKALIPFIHLRNEFELSGNPPKTERIVIINKNDVRVAIVADKIIGEHQAVIKPLGQLFKNQDFLLGASVMGDGNMALMLDTQRLAENVFNE